MLEVYNGGLTLLPSELELINISKSITQKINEKFITVGVPALKPLSKEPIDGEWFKVVRGSFDFNQWIDDDDKARLNAGFNLQDGWLDVDIDTMPDDPRFKQSIVAAMHYLQVDSRLAFGRRSSGVPSHLLLQLDPEDACNYDQLRLFEPKFFFINDKRYHVQLRSTQMDNKDPNAKKQVVAPGSLYPSKTEGEVYDPSVWWLRNDTGYEIATTTASIITTTVTKVNFENIVKAVTFGVIRYVVEPFWLDGSRQDFARKLSGWLARIVAESNALNTHATIGKNIMCPIRSNDEAVSLITFLCKSFGDTEISSRVRTYWDATNKLNRNPDAHIPGWGSMREEIGTERVNALRAVISPGADVSELHVMAERYIYDDSNNTYIDRERHSMYDSYVHKSDELERRHKGETIIIGGKIRPVWTAFECSALRKHVGLRDLYPDLEPGVIYRIGPGERVLDDEDETPGIVIYNSWRGLTIKPPDRVDQQLVTHIIRYLDHLLGLLTQHNEKQIEWIKKWIAWTFQHPGIKQQVSWTVVGGMGTGKSFMGEIFMKSILGDLWGSASSKILDGKFVIGAFKDKLFVFIDEADFNKNPLAVEEVKKIIRNVNVPGEEKFAEARNYRIFARIMFASNKQNTGVGSRDVRDRVLFYTKAVDAKYKNMTASEFETWAETLKPFFAEFAELLTHHNVLQHFVHYFMTLPVERREIESIAHSSSSDPEILAANMSWSRRIAKELIEQGYIAYQDLAFEMPFDVMQFNARVTELGEQTGLKVKPDGVWAELDKMMMFERHAEMVNGAVKRIYRTRLRWASSCELFEANTGVKVEPYREFVDTDYGKNDTILADKKPRLGANAARF